MWHFSFCLLGIQVKIKFCQLLKYLCCYLSSFESDSRQKVFYPSLNDYVVGWRWKSTLDRFPTRWPWNYTEKVIKRVAIVAFQIRPAVYNRNKDKFYTATFSIRIEREIDVSWRVSWQFFMLLFWIEKKLTQKFWSWKGKYPFQDTTV